MTSAAISGVADGIGRAYMYIGKAMSSSDTSEGEE